MHLRKALDLRQRLADAHSAGVDELVALVAVLQQSGDLELVRGHSDRAQEYFDRAEAIERQIERRRRFLMRDAVS
jgi:hypothetical protein